MCVVRATLSYEFPSHPAQLQLITKFLDEEKKLISFEYDASRLKESEVAHVLRQALLSLSGPPGVDGRKPSPATGGVSRHCQKLPNPR